VGLGQLEARAGSAGHVRSAGDTKRESVPPSCISQRAGAARELSGDSALHARRGWRLIFNRRPQEWDGLLGHGDGESLAKVCNRGPAIGEAQSSIGSRRPSQLEPANPQHREIITDPPPRLVFGGDGIPALMRRFDGMLRLANFAYIAIFPPRSLPRVSQHLGSSSGRPKDMNVPSPSRLTL
jgi:hypothetical protein